MRALLYESVQCLCIYILDTCAHLRGPVLLWVIPIWVFMCTFLYMPGSTGCTCGNPFLGAVTCALGEPPTVGYALLGES